eukprot:1677009-Amphidinium_carterae.1
MGDAKSPAIAQMVHQHVLLAGRDPLREDWGQESSADVHPLVPKNWMTYGHPSLADAHWSGAYVDDFVLATIESAQLQHLWQRDFSLEHASIVQK